MDYMKKYDKNPFEDLFWNVPEQKKGVIGVIGGNLQSFRTPTKIAEFLAGNFPLKEVRVILPDALKDKLPTLDNLVFLKSTDAGSFADAEEITGALNATDFNLMIGDFSRNSITEKAVRSAGESSAKPLLITRDTIDLVATDGLEKLLMNENIILMGSFIQLQKIFRVVYYPRVLTMSQSLIQVAEAMHKFTLSYPAKIITLHNEQILVAENGNVAVVPLNKTAYTPITVWGGELAAKVATINLYNPNNFLKATTAAIFAN